MSDALYRQIRENLDRKSTAELKRIVAEQHTGEWSEDAIKAATELLAARPEEPDEPVPSPATASGSVESDRIDRRGKGVFTLTPEEIADYRSKIQLLGWVFCVMGALVIVVLLGIPLIYGRPKLGLLPILGFAALGTGLPYIVTGAGLIRRKPFYRVPGLVLSIPLLFAFPIGTLIGLGGIFWLGKRGSVLDPRPEKASDPVASSRDT